MDKRRLRVLGTFRRLVAAFIENNNSSSSSIPRLTTEPLQSSTPPPSAPPSQQREVVSTVIEFLRLLITIDGPASADEMPPVPQRTVVLTGQQLGVVLSYWTKELASSVVVAEPTSLLAATPVSIAVDNLPVEVKTEPGTGHGEEDVKKMEVVASAEGESAAELVTASNEDVDAAVLKHPILELREYLELHRSEANDPLLDKCNEIISYLEGARELTDEQDLKSDEKDALLPQPEGIVAQYATRQVYTLVQASDERLKLNYWLNPPNYEMELGEVEQIPCDLTELIKTCLPADTNLVADCKRILNLSVSPQSNRERTVTAPCFRTRRIEMEPIGGRMDKKFLGKGECEGS